MTSSRQRVDVAVVVPVHNRLRLLKDTVQSLRAQTLQSAEFILVDDGSAQDTSKYLDSLPAMDDRFRVLRKPANIERGGQTSRNWGLEHCTADAVVFLDSDDLLAPSCLAERWRHLQKNPSVDIVVGRQVILDESTGSIRWVNVYRHGVAHLDRFLDLAGPLDVPWVTGGALFRKARIDECNIRWIPDLLWQDVVFHIQPMIAGFKVAWLPPGEPDAIYRRHGGDHFGRVLMTPKGMHGIVVVLSWINTRLSSAGQLTEGRVTQLEKAFFHTCLLRAIDGGYSRLAWVLIEDAIEKQLLRPAVAAKMRIYLSGRRASLSSFRAAYYWNRLCKRTFLGDFYPARRSTYGSEELSASSKEKLLALLQPVADLRNETAPPLEIL